MLVVTENIHIPAFELQWSFARSSGSGGQNVNKVSSKALLRFNVLYSPSLPDDVRERCLRHFQSRLTQEGDLLITSDRHRDRPMNMKDCLEKLRQMILSVAVPPKPRKKTKPTKSSQRRRVETKRRHSEKKSQRRGDWE